MAEPHKPLSQDDIDALIGEIAAASPPVVKVDNPAPSNAAAGIIGQAKDPGHMPAMIGKATHSLGNDDMDAMVQAPLESAPPAPPATLGSAAPTTKSVPRPGTRRVPATAPERTGSPTERTANPTERMDALLTSMETKAHEKAKDALTGNIMKSKDSSLASGPLGQDDIDRLLSELGAGQPAKPPTVRAAAADAKRPTTKQISAPPPLPTTTVTARAPGATPPETTTAKPGSASDTLKLKPEEIDALVTKQAGMESDHTEAPMIDQGDIDALVKQLANATGAPDTKHISDALAQHGGEIDKLLEKAGEIRSTSDAIDMAHAPTILAPKAAILGGHTTTVMVPAEIRGAHWLLGAVLIFLAICCASLMIIVTAINGLTRELHTSHPTAMAPSDSFGEDLKAALAKLASPDDGEVTKGVLFLQRLKNRHPSHLIEISLTLVRHFREHGAHRQAVAEFAELNDNSNSLFDDPRLYLDYADSLAKTDDRPGALRQVYVLLANEAAYLSSHDAHNLPRPSEEVARNHQVIQEAYLTLGQLLDQSPTDQKTATPEAGAPAAPEAPEAHAEAAHSAAEPVLPASATTPAPAVAVPAPAAGDKPAVVKAAIAPAESAAPPSVQGAPGTPGTATVPSAPAVPAADQVHP